MLTIKTAHLRRALDLGGRAAEKRTTVPALATVRLTTDARRELLHVESTNMDICATASAPCDPGETKIDVCLPNHRTISKALREIGGEDTTIEHEVMTSPHKSGEITTDTVLIASGEFRCRVAALAATESPQWTAGGADVFKVEVGADFARALEKVRGACSTEETRYYLNGVYLGQLKDGYHPLVATDGHRLHKVDFPLPGLEGEVPGIIIPRGLLSLAVPLMIEAAKKEPVALSMGRGKGDALVLKLTLGEVALQIRGKLIDGTFPDYGRASRPRPSIRWSSRSTPSGARSPPSRRRAGRRPARASCSPATRTTRRSSCRRAGPRVSPARTSPSRRHPAPGSTSGSTPNTSCRPSTCSAARPCACSGMTTQARLSGDRPRTIRRWP